MESDCNRRDANVLHRFAKSAEALVAQFSLREQLHITRFGPSVHSLSFVSHVERLLAARQGELAVVAAGQPLMRFMQDQNSPVHRWLYESHPERDADYRAICQLAVREVIKEPAYAQVMPCYRVGFPGNRWVGCFHRDSDFGHSPAEVNVICALTAMAGSAALQVEDSPGSCCYESLDLKRGELVTFDHIDRLHGCKRNRTGQLVMSIDFRFIPVSLAGLAFSSAATTVNTQMPLLPGAYFSAEPLLP